MDPAGALNYTDADFRRIRELAGGPFEVPEDLRRVLDAIGYLEDWRTAYRVQSVQASLHAKKITCIDSAILAYGLSSLGLKLLALIHVTGPHRHPVSLQLYLYHRVFVPLAGASGGSLLHAVTYTLLWLAVMAVLYRRGLFVKI